MVRLLLVNHCGEMSGAEVSLLGLIRHADQESFEFHLAAPAGPLLQLAAEAGAEVHPTPLSWIRRPRFPWHFLGAWRDLTVGRTALSEVAEHVAPDLIHANGAFAHLFASGLRRRHGPPVIWHVRDLHSMGFLGRYLGRRADRIVAISEAVRQRCLLWARSPDQVVVVHNGVDVHAFPAGGPESRAAVRAELGLPEDAMVFGCIGQAVAFKRHEHFLAAAVRLAGRGYRFVLVRTDPFGHGKPLRGFVPSEVLRLDQYGDIPGLMAALDVLVQPSYCEPFGRTVIEAMASSCPVIVTDSGGPPEILGDSGAGVVVPTDDVPALTRAMSELAEDADRRMQMGRAGRERVLKRFTAKRCARAMEEVYRQALGPAGAG